MHLRCHRYKKGCYELINYLVITSTSTNNLILVIICQILCTICQTLYLQHWVYMILLWLDSIHDQLYAITENLQVLLAELTCKLQNNVFVSVEGGTVVERSLQNTQLADGVNKVFKCLICHSLMTLPIPAATCCKQVRSCGTCLKNCLVNHNSSPLCRSNEIATIHLTSFSELLEKARKLYDLWSSELLYLSRIFIYSASHQL